MYIEIEFGVTSTGSDYNTISNFSQWWREISMKHRSVVLLLLLPWITALTRERSCSFLFVILLRNLWKSVFPFPMPTTCREQMYPMLFLGAGSFIQRHNNPFHWILEHSVLQEVPQIRECGCISAFQHCLRTKWMKWAKWKERALCA